MVRTATNPLGRALPLAAAPMAGGATTPRLATAVSEAGAFVFLTSGSQTPEAAGDPHGVHLWAGTGFRSGY
jgi:nitronate monooxygenase